MYKYATVANNLKDDMSVSVLFVHATVKWQERLLQVQ